jgi:hypothetical protein
MSITPNGSTSEKVQRRDGRFVHITLGHRLRRKIYSKVVIVTHRCSKFVESDALNVYGLSL